MELITGANYEPGRVEEGNLVRFRELITEPSVLLAAANMAVDIREINGAVTMD